MASSMENRLYFSIVYTDGSRSAINYQGDYPNSNTFIDINKTTDINKTIDFMKGDHSAGERMYIDVDSFQIEEGTEATTYEPYIISSSTLITQNKNHTLTAIWEKID